MSAVRRGVFLPAFDALADAAVIAELAAEAETAGWDGFFLWDHLAYAVPVVALADPWTCLTAAAMVTDRITLGPMVTPLSRRRPQVVARQAVTLDRLSRGRFVLGCGLGDDGTAQEMSRFGEEPSAVVRAGMLDEGLAVVTGLLSGSPVDHRGEHYTVRAQFAPPPWRPGGIPVWLAARWPHRRPLARAVRYDGAFVIGLSGPGDVAALVERVAALRNGSGEFDLVIEAPDDALAAWALPGVSWVLTRFGPYRLDLTAVRERIRRGP